MTWVHSCVAIDSALNHLTVVVNGKKLEDKAFPIPAGAQPPTNLTEKLLLFKRYQGFWYQSKNKISNLNIFSKQLTFPEMVSRTAGEDCGKADGDYLAWESSEWSLKGKASFHEVTVEDLCRRESRIQVFTSPIGSMDQCKNLCEKMQNGTMTPVRTPNESQKMFDRIDKVLTPNGKPTKAGRVGQALWAPAIRQASNDTWVDLYNNKDPVNEITWAAGHPTSESCAIYVVPWKAFGSYPCTLDTKVSIVYCPCFFPDSPHLTLRGLCPDSYIDQAYLARNDPVTGFLYFYGTHKTIARFDGKKWKMTTAFYNTSASTDAMPATFILGKHNWTISGDSEECNSGKPYTTELKLTGCAEGDFTCNDGQCVKMVDRCNQVPDCRDKSDEKGCQLILFEEDYNKNIPPIGRADDGGVVPANVTLNVTLKKVVEIEERDHSIHLQFEINLQWRENRVKYQNLKDKTSLNALTSRDISRLWMPLVIYDNTDQEESTRLGMEWEWVTGVSVIKEGHFTRSGLQEVDETEIFEGNENTLMMTQTYTREFQCKYKLQQYPFDSQVNKTPNMIPMNLRNVPSKWA